MSSIVSTTRSVKEKLMAKDYTKIYDENERLKDEIAKLKANQFPPEPICSECGKPRKCLGILWETHYKPCKH